VLAAATQSWVGATDGWVGQMCSRREFAAASTAWDSFSDCGPVFSPVLTGIDAAIHVWRARPRVLGRAAEIVLRGVFAGVVGVGGLVVTASHLFFANARRVGRPREIRY
jgi:hypothetical protein